MLCVYSHCYDLLWVGALFLKKFNKPRYLKIRDNIAAEKRNPLPQPHTQTCHPFNYQCSPSIGASSTRPCINWYYFWVDGARLPQNFLYVCTIAFNKYCCYICMYPGNNEENRFLKIYLWVWTRTLLSQLKTNDMCDLVIFFLSKRRKKCEPFPPPIPPAKKKQRNKKIYIYIYICIRPVMALGCVGARVGIHVT